MQSIGIFTLVDNVLPAIVPAAVFGVNLYPGRITQLSPAGRLEVGVITAVIASCEQSLS